MEKIAKLFFKFFSICFFIRLHVALFAFVTVFYLMRCAGISSFHPLTPFVSFFIVAAVYLDNIFTDVKEDKANSRDISRFIADLNLLQVLKKGHIFFYFLALSLSIIVGKACFFWSVVAVIICFSYANRWLPNPRGELLRIKDIFILKNIFPGIGCVIIVAVIPFVSSGVKIIQPYIFLLVLVFLLEVRDEIKFDISDTVGDKKAGIKTFPNILGENGTKKLLFFINSVSGFLFFLMLLILSEGKYQMLDSFLRNGVPLLAVILGDYIYVDFLFRRKKKDYLNIGMLWGVFLIIIFLILPFPFNICVYLVLNYSGWFLKFCNILKSMNGKNDIQILDLT